MSSVFCWVRDYTPVRRGQDKAGTASEQESEQLSEKKGQSHGTQGDRSPNTLGHREKGRKYENYAAPWVKIKGWGGRGIKQ